MEEKRILIDGSVLEYYPYYFDIWRDTVDHRLTVKCVLEQWATALGSLSSREGAVYLPYFRDDETCRYLKAELDGEDIVTHRLASSQEFWCAVDGGRYVDRWTRITQMRKVRLSS